MVETKIDNIEKDKLIRKDKQIGDFCQFLRSAEFPKREKTNPIVLAFFIKAMDFEIFLKIFIVSCSVGKWRAKIKGVNTDKNRKEMFNASGHKNIPFLSSNIF